MEIELHPEAAEELNSFDNQVSKELRNRLEELKENPASHENSKPIQVRGRPIFRYEMKDGRSDDIDHRAVYDIENGRIVVYAVFHRDQGYEKNSIDRRF